jgi:hypothetical protein
MAKNTTDFQKLKAPNQPTNYTKEQLQELVNCAKDPLYFMEKYMYVQHSVKGKIPFEAYEFQKKLIHGYNNFRNVIAMIPRQSGKCISSHVQMSIKNKQTGEIFEIPIGIYYEWARCMRDGRTPPDISVYKKHEVVSTNDGCVN